MAGAVPTIYDLIRVDSIGAALTSGFNAGVLALAWTTSDRYGSSSRGPHNHWPHTFKGWPTQLT